MSQPETLLVNRIKKAIKSTWPDCWVLKVHGSVYQAGGIPDLLVCVQGKFFGIEVKSQGNGESAKHAYDRTTIRQQIQKDRISHAGGFSATVLSPLEACQFIQSHL